jgi:HEAT repeat protein
MDPDGRRRLLDEAIAASRAAETPDDYEGVWAPLQLVAESGADADTLALEMIGSDDPCVRATGCDLLGLLCERFEEPRTRATAALVALAVEEADVDVQWSIARALGSTADPDGLPVLLALADHPDSDVRFQVAVSLPSTMLERMDERGIHALIELSRDPDGDVRNWATFGLGRQLDCDSTEIREALWVRVDDDNVDAREEAIVGLARRRDQRSLPLVVELLAGVEVPSSVFDAAAYLADPSLLPLLSEYDAEVPEVARALRWCDPADSEQRDRDYAAFLGHVQGLLDERSTGGYAALWCDWLGLDVNVTTVIGDQEWTGWADGLLAEATDPASAARRWIEQAEATGPDGTANV